MAAGPDKSLPTALLLHRTAEGDHFDWLLVDPRTADDAEARLWTARVAHPSSHWRELGQFELEAIAPHRREYLTYEGPISGNRGSVTRVDEGSHRAIGWTDERIELELSMREFHGRLELTHGEGAKWMARVVK